MPVSDKLKELVKQIPDPDKNGTYGNIDEKAAEKIREIVTLIRAGGNENLLGLIDMFNDPNADGAMKAKFALHLIAVRVTDPGADDERAKFALAILPELTGKRPKLVREYLIEQIQLAGGNESLKALGKLLSDPELCDNAARALAAIGGDAPAVLLAALPSLRGKSRRIVIRKLAVLKATAAADVFKRALDDGDADIRIAAAWGISRIADASAANAMLKTAEAHQGTERNSETDACLDLADNLVAADRKSEAARIYDHLRKTRTDPAEKHFRDAAERGFAAVKQFV